MEDSGYLEPHFNWVSDLTDQSGLVTLGPLTSANFIRDPKSILFRAARYKFVAKMFEGFDSVLEVGCGDASMSPIVRQSVNLLTAVDNDLKMIEHAIKYTKKEFKIQFECLDISEIKKETLFNGIFSLDVLEHIPKILEEKFLNSCVRLLKTDGILIIGTPSLAAQEFTTLENKAGHVNCKSDSELSDSLKKYFSNVFTFGMNDEMINTGYAPFRNYLFAICTNPRKLVHS